MQSKKSIFKQGGITFCIRPQFFLKTGKNPTGFRYYLWIICRVEQIVTVNMFSTFCIRNITPQGNVDFRIRFKIQLPLKAPTLTFYILSSINTFKILHSDVFCRSFRRDVPVLRHENKRIIEEVFHGITLDFVSTHC